MLLFYRENGLSFDKEEENDRPSNPKSLKIACTSLPLVAQSAYSSIFLK